MLSRAILVTLLLVVLALPAGLTALSSGQATASVGLSSYISGAVASVNVTQIRQYASALSSFGTRVTGYAGNIQAAKYIEGVLKEDGITVVNQSFTSAEPIDTGSWVYLPSTGENLTVYALWPNGPVPGYTPGYVNAPLVYVGNGSLAEMDGKKINGSIVVEDFNSGSNWIYAAELGAKAIVFLAPNETTSLESRVKANPNPIYMPRVYANGEAASALLKASLSGQTAYLHDGMKWENATSYNIIGIINGTQDPNDIVIASAHYDSWSVVPSVAPGGQDALGISTLLDLARYFAQHRPYRTLWIVAYSGYWEGLVGPYAFVHQFVYSESNLAGTTRIWMDIDLDLSSGSSSLDGLYYGMFNGFSLGSYAETKYYAYFQPEVSSFFSEAGINTTLSTGLPALTLYASGDQDWGTQPTYYMLDTEPFSQTNELGLTLRTSFDLRTTWLTPLNDLPETNWANLGVEARTAAVVISGFADEPDLGISWSSVAPTYMASTPGGYVGFITVDVRTVQFSPNVSWYVPVPGSLVQVPRGASGNPDWWEFGSQWYITNANGSLDYYGAVPYWGWSFLAWKINSSTGQLDYAVNNGIYGTAHGISGGLNTGIPIVISQPSYISIPMFQAEPITIFNVLDPRTMSPAAIYDPRNTYMSFFGEPAVLSVYKFTTRATPMFWYIDYIPATEQATVFVQKGENVAITYDPYPLQVGPLIILDNASASHPRGSGFTVNGPLSVQDTFYVEAKDMYLLVQERYANLKAHYATSPGLVLLMDKAGQYLRYAQNNLSAMNYSAAYNDSMVSLAYSSQAYATQLMPMYGQISGSMVFFSFLVIPFGYFFEEYALHLKGVWRVIGMFAVIIVFVYIFSIINPALSVISNSTLTLLGVGLLIFALFVAWVFYGETTEIVRESARERLGLHEVTGSTMAASTHAAMTAVENMRRRPLLSALTLLTVVIFAAGNVALTSTSSSLGIAPGSVPTSVPPQEAIFVKWYRGMPPEILGNQLLNYLAGIGGNNFYYWPEYLYYPTLLYRIGVYEHQIVTPVQRTGTNVTSLQMLVFMGVSSGEAQQYFGRFIEAGNTSMGSDGVIIPDTLAQALGVGVGQNVTFLGVGTFKVVGIFNSSAVGARPESTYDGMPSLPVAPVYNSQVNQGYTPSYVSTSMPEPVLGSQFVVIPWQSARALGGFLTSVEMVPKYQMTRDQLMQYASAMRFPITPSVYVGYSGKSVGLSVVSTYSFLGLSVTIILLLIAALAILNAMYENVLIRRREIYTYASLGLSPSGATVMFITEAAVYALIGAVIGFLLGFFLDFIFMTAHVLPPSFTFNFTSWSLILSLLLILVATLGGSIYPSRISSRLITPSLTRRWRPSTRAKGREWSIELPMRLKLKEEALGVLRYLQEYYAGIGYEKPSFRVERMPQLDEQNNKLSLRVRLPPYEMGIVQDVDLQFVQGATMEYVLYAAMKLVTGDPGLWQSHGLGFLEDLRAQVILWRALKPEERNRYITGQRGAASGAPGGGAPSAGQPGSEGKRPGIEDLWNPARTKR